MESRKVAEGNISCTFLISGTNDQTAAANALMADAPTTLECLRRYWFPGVEPVWSDDVQVDGLWTGTVVYMAWPRLEINIQTITASTSGGTQHIKCSRNTAGKYSASGDAPDMGGCIGASKDGVEGVDIIVPVFNFKVRKALPGKPNFSALYNLTGKINSGAFTVHDNWNGESVSVAAGECLFRGAEVPEPRKEDGACEVTYDFSASPNMSNLQVGPIGSISKNGWQYLWVFFVNQIIGSGDTQILAPQPKFVYVEDVYQSGDFSALGLT
jgi:hypothetical protein